MRLPTVFTALSNILCGYLVSQPECDPAAVFASPTPWLLMLASAGLYLGGMVLNDVFDAALDSVERPERPIPSGRITRTAAAAFGSLLLALGLVAAAAADMVSGSDFIAVQTAAVLAVAIVLYDAVLKSTPAGPFGMATCRFLNLMLGASCAGSLQYVYSSPQLTIALALFVYVVGVTWFARNEAGQSTRSALIMAFVIVLAGIGIDAWAVFRTLPNAKALVESFRTPAVGALIALGLVAANLSWRISRAIRVNQPRLLQKSVGFMLLNIIFIDAALTFAVTGSGRLAACIVILVLPATYLKRIIPMS